MSNYKTENRKLAKWLEDNERGAPPIPADDNRTSIHRRRQLKRKKRSGV